MSIRDIRRHLAKLIYPEVFEVTTGFSRPHFGWPVDVPNQKPQAKPPEAPVGPSLAREPAMSGLRGDAFYKHHRKELEKVMMTETDPHVVETVRRQLQRLDASLNESYPRDEYGQGWPSPEETVNKELASRAARLLAEAQAASRKIREEREAMEKHEREVAELQREINLLLIDEVRAEAERSRVTYSSKDEVQKAVERRRKKILDSEGGDSLLS